jgi:hypothetical protein
MLESAILSAFPVNAVDNVWQFLILSVCAV